MEEKPEENISYQNCFRLFVFLILANSKPLVFISITLWAFRCVSGYKSGVKKKQNKTWDSDIEVALSVSEGNLLMLK